MEGKRLLNGLGIETAGACRVVRRDLDLIVAWPPRLAWQSSVGQGAQEGSGSKSN